MISRVEDLEQSSVMTNSQIAQIKLNADNADRYYERDLNDLREDVDGIRDDIPSLGDLESAISELQSSIASIQDDLSDIILTGRGEG